MSDLLDPPAPAPAPNTTPPAPTPPPSPAPNTTPPSPTFTGELPENWHLALGDKYAPHSAELSRYKTMDAVLESLFYHRSKNGIPIPTPESTPEQIADYRRALGVPEKWEDYAIAAPEKLPEGMVWDEERTSALLQKAHEIGIPKSAMQQLAAAHTANEVARFTAAQQAEQSAVAEARAALQNEWGSKFDENAGNIRHVLGVLAEKAAILPDDPALKAIANNPAACKILLKVAEMTTEDPTRTPPAFRDIRSPQARANAIMDGTDPELGQAYLGKTTRAAQANAQAILQQLLQQTQA